MSLCLASAIEANKNNIIERDGIYFKHMAQVSMGKLTWTVITDIDLSQIDKTIEQISDEIKRANKTHLPFGDTNFTLTPKYKITTNLNSHNEQLKTIRLNIPLQCTIHQLPIKHDPPNPWTNYRIDIFFSYKYHSRIKSNLLE